MELGKKTDLEKKLDHLLGLLEEQEAASFRQSCQAPQMVYRDLIINVILGSCVGYFIMRVLDHHFR